MSIPSSDFILRGRVRGFPHNREDFLKIFIDRWDGFIDDFERNTYSWQHIGILAKQISNWIIRNEEKISFIVMLLADGQTNEIKQNKRNS